METNTGRRAVSRLTNRIFILVVVVTNTFGNILLAIGMKRMPDFYALPLFSYIAILGKNWHVLGGTALLSIWMLGQLSMFTWADLTYVLPVTSSGYILTAILGKFLLGEQISFIRWIGITVIFVGVMLVSETPLDTKHEGQIAT